MACYRRGAQSAMGATTDRPGRGLWQQRKQRPGEQLDGEVGLVAWSREARTWASMARAPSAEAWGRMRGGRSDGATRLEERGSGALSAGLEMESSGSAPWRRSTLEEGRRSRGAAQLCGS
jgi:hypothetical protein